MAPPGVGGKKIKHNTRERVLSGDHNREQAVHDQMLAEILRCLTDPLVELDTQAGSVEVFSSGSEVPLRATILAGIRPRPEVGTVNLFIEPGTLTISDTPLPTTDDSRSAFVVDPGEQTAGILTLTPGSGGAIRIDVIECQRVETVLETDSRDIFNSITGLFSPILVDKVVTARLAYRIRLGTPGAGFPGVDAAWLPLAVCAVPAAATTWDDVILWDVRPLASDRVKAPFNAYPSLNYVHRQNVFCDYTTAPGEIRMKGVTDCSFGAYAAGGQILGPGSTGTAYFNIADSTFWAASLSAANMPWYMYLVFPFGLPRWVQYCPASAGIREPRGLRGIPVISRWTPRYDGRPLTPIAQTPAWTGLLDTGSQDAVVAVAGLQGPVGGPYGIIVDGTVTNIQNTVGVEVNSTSSSGNLWSQWTLTDNVFHAGNARAVYVKIRVSLNVTVSGLVTMDQLSYISGPGNAFVDISIFAGQSGNGRYVEASVAGGFEIEFFLRVPLAIDQTYASARAFMLRWEHNFGGTATFTVTGRRVLVLGWELGP